MKPSDLTLGNMVQLKSCPYQWIDWVKRGKSVLTPIVVSVDEIHRDFVKRYLDGKLARETDHKYYRIDNGELIKIPNSHGSDLRYYEFHNIIGKAGLTSPEYFAAKKKTNNWRMHTPRSQSLPSTSSSVKNSHF